jgi:hypothetical protein
MKKLTTAALLIGMIATTVSCKKEVIGNGPVTTQPRTVNSFSGIILEMNGNVYYKNDTEWSVEVSAKESIHPILETKVVNDRLVIRYSNGKTYDEDESIRITVSGPDVSSFELNTSGSIYVMNDIQAPNVYLSTKGSGSISMQRIDAANLTAQSLQSGTITAASGSAINSNLKSDASGKVDLSGITTKYVTAHTIGSGDITVKATDKLDATIKGSGSIYFSGSPLITSHVSGTGRLVRF